MKKKLLSAVLLTCVLVSLSMPLYAMPGAGEIGEPEERPDPFVQAFVLE